MNQDEAGGMTKEELIAKINKQLDDAGVKQQRSGGDSVNALIYRVGVLTTDYLAYKQQ